MDTTKLIECKLIDVPKVSSDTRTFSKEFAVKLADSLKIDGQLVPVGVRPNPTSPSRYILIYGKHRLYGMKNVLKEQFINATIFESMDETEANIATDVENLWRNSLNKAQHAAAIKRWHENYLSKLPQLVKPVANPIAESAEAVGHSDEPKAATNAIVSEASSEAEFDAKVAAVTGESKTTVQRSKRIAKAFTPEQLEVFVQMDVNQKDMLTIAKIEDEAKRGQVVNLVASGMVVDDAIKEIMKEAAPARYNDAEAEDRTTKKEAKAAAKQETQAELSDDDWFEQNCGEKAKMLGNPSKYRADAMLFRLVSDLRHAFRIKSKKDLATAKKCGVTGAFYNLVNRFVSISHPKDWNICPECKGAGKVPSGATEIEIANMGPGYAYKNCPKCFGGGYLLKTEEYA